MSNKKKDPAKLLRKLIIWALMLGYTISVFIWWFYVTSADLHAPQLLSYIQMIPLSTNFFLLACIGSVIMAYAADNYYVLFEAGTSKLRSRMIVCSLVIAGVAGIAASIMAHFWLQSVIGGVYFGTSCLLAIFPPVLLHQRKHFPEEDSH